MLDRVLLPLDFSEQSLMMVDCIAELKRFGMKEVILLNVFQKGSIVAEESKEQMERSKEKLEAIGFEVSTMTVMGEPVEMILKVAKDEGVTAIAMASSGKGRGREFFVGSTSLGVIRRSKIPVLLDKFRVVEEETGEIRIGVACFTMLRTALVPVDLTPCTETVKEAVRELISRGLERVVFLNVVESSRYSVTDDKVFDDVRNRLDSIRKDLEGEKVEVITHIHYGTPTYNILEVAREFSATVIVLGTRGKSLLREITLGSTSEEVIRKANVSILAIPC
jgi:nucleotide-binding universal stress UspA family protein